MNVAATLGNILYGLGLVVTLIAAIFTAQQASSTKEQTRYIRQQIITAEGAAKIANEALCQTLETGLDMVELARIAVFQGGFIQKFESSEKEQEYRDKLKARTAFFNRLYAQHKCPPRIGE